MRHWWILVGCAVQCAQRAAFSYLENIVSNHQLEFGGQWQLRYVIDSNLGGKRYKKKRAEKIKKQKLAQAERKKREINDGKERIVGGFEVTDKSWQFMVDIGGLCGGSLISNQMVLTAAHCCTKSSFEFSVIRLGIKDFTDTRNSVNRVPRDKIVHPEFNAENFKHDICLVLLNETVEFSERIQPISLPLPEETLFETESGNPVHALVAGWGTTGELNSAPINELFPTQLMNAMVPFVLDADCESEAFYGPLVDTRFVFCAGSAQADTCQFDSGGPAVVLKQRNSRYEDLVPILAGITSWGEGCARENRPGVYTRVTSYLEWIRKSQLQFEGEETDCSDIEDLIHDEEENLTYRCSKLDQRCWFHCPAGSVPSVISLRCRNKRQWVPRVRPESIRCEVAKSPETACGELTDGIARNGREFNFNTKHIEARCNSGQECLFYCRGSDTLAKGMFYTKCKMQSHDKSRWKPRPRITQEPHC